MTGAWVRHNINTRAGDISVKDRQRWRRLHKEDTPQFCLLAMYGMLYYQMYHGMEMTCEFPKEQVFEYLQRFEAGVLYDLHSDQEIFCFFQRAKPVPEISIQ